MNSSTVVYFLSIPVLIICRSFLAHSWKNLFMNSAPECLTLDISNSLQLVTIPSLVNKKLESGQIYNSLYGFSSTSSIEDMTSFLCQKNSKHIL